ncbi:hypothetical protein D3C72_1266940 [compost metagenome]
MNIRWECNGVTCRRYDDTDRIILGFTPGLAATRRKGCRTFYCSYSQTCRAGKGCSWRSDGTGIRATCCNRSCRCSTQFCCRIKNTIMVPVCPDFYTRTESRDIYFKVECKCLRCGHCKCGIVGITKVTTGAAGIQVVYIGNRTGSGEAVDRTTIGTTGGIYRGTVTVDKAFYRNQFFIAEYWCTTATD